MVSRQNERQRMLSPYTVLDLSMGTEVIGARILGDLGANVISIEPPSGSAVRRMAPFYKSDPHRERSLWWWAYAAGRRSITLDITSVQGKVLMRKLVTSADFLFESFSPGYLSALDLGYEALSLLNPGLIMVSMTPFGQTGPYMTYSGPDIVGMATGGFMHLTGDPDRPPIRVTVPQFGLHMGASGATGAMIAHHHRLLTSQGQYVDVSGQEAVARTLSHAPSFWNLNQVNLSRQGVYRPGIGGGRSRTTWPCKDGYVNYALSAGPLGGGTNSLIQWMEEEGVHDEFLGSLDWTQIDTNNEDGLGLMQKAAIPIQEFFMTKTKSELYEAAVQRRVLLFPVNAPDDIHSEVQLAARKYFQNIEHPAEGQSFEYPGSFIQSSETSINPTARAPALGEHNTEVYVRELGFSTNDLVLLRQASVI